jgi:hypothetical protein
MVVGRNRTVLCWVIAALSLPLAAAAQVGPLGLEFQINTYTDGNQDDVALAADADGDFIVVWASDGQDASGKGIFARRFSSAGAPVGGEFQVNLYTVNIQQAPAVSADPDGDFVIAWASPQDGSSFGVFARRYSSAGAALDVEFQVNTYATGLQSNMAIAHHPDGDFVVVWEDNGRDGSNYGVFARRFSSAGQALGTEFQINTFFTNVQNRPSMGIDPGGGFVVAWSSLGQDGSIGGVFARRFTSAGTALATEFQVNTYTSGGQLQSTVSVDAEGDFVIAWNGPELAGAGLTGVFAQRFSSAGDFLGGEFQLNAYTLGSQSRIQLAGEPDGDFVAIWQSDSDGFGNGVFGRSFSSAGDPLASEFQVNTYTTNSQSTPSIATDAEGDFVVAWQSQYQEGDYAGYGIFARRFGIPSSNFDIDGNGVKTALTDGLLLLRYLFGFRGNTLVNGAVGTLCTRCEAPAIEAHIAAHLL